MSPDASRPEEPDASRAANGGKKKPPKQDGSNARERARIAAERSSRQSKRRKLAFLVIAIVVVVAAAGVGIGYATNFGNPTSSAGNGSPTWGPVKVTDGQPITLGKADAPVSVKLYEDFRCPHCEAFEQQYSDTLLNYQKQGKVKLEIYALTVIDNEDGTQGSLRAGNAFACAAEEGFGQAYYQGLWANYGKNWSNDQLTDLADQVGNPSAGFGSCVTGMKHQSWMQSAATAANTDKVQGTPTMFINGQLQDLENMTEQKMKDAIDQAAQ